MIMVFTMCLSIYFCFVIIKTLIKNVCLFVMTFLIIIIIITDKTINYKTQEQLNYNSLNILI